MVIPSGANVTVSAPADTNRPGSPKSACWAGVSTVGWFPFSRKVTEPSGKSTSFTGPDVFAVMVFPFAVSEISEAPVNSLIVDPSAALSVLTNTLWTSCVPLDLESADVCGHREGRGLLHELPLRPPGERRGGRHHPSEDAQQDGAKHHDPLLKSPHGDHPSAPPTVARCRAYRPAAGHAAVAITDLPLHHLLAAMSTPRYRPCGKTHQGTSSGRAESGSQRAEGARVLAGLRSGDSPLSVRARPSSLKRDCDRRATSTGERCPVNVHTKSRLTLEPLRTLRSGDKGQAGACPDRARAIPCTMRAVTGDIHSLYRS